MSGLLGCKPGISPVLISGVYRSGTTYLAALVNRIPNIAVASSTVKYLRLCLPRYGEPQGEALNAMLEETKKRLSARWGLEFDVNAVRCLLAGRAATHAEAYDAMMRVLTSTGTGSGSPARWGEKVNTQWREIEPFLQMFPDGRVLHVIRDPRDVTASYKNFTYEPWPTFMDAALNCKGAMREVVVLREHYGHDRILLLRAEDISSELGEQMRRICEFLDEPFDPAMADFEAIGELTGEDWRDNTSFASAAYRDARPRWPEHLTAEELFLVEMVCQPEMADNGYIGSGQDLRRLDWSAFGRMLEDRWFGEQVRNYLTTGHVRQGYRTDPVVTELRAIEPRSS